MGTVHGSRRARFILLRARPRISLGNCCIKSNGATVDAQRGSRYSRNTGIGTQPQSAAMQDTPEVGRGCALRSSTPFKISRLP